MEVGEAMLSYSWLRWCTVVIAMLLDLRGNRPPGCDPAAVRGIPRNDTQAAVNMSQPYERHCYGPCLACWPVSWSSRKAESPVNHQTSLSFRCPRVVSATDASKIP